MDENADQKFEVRCDAGDAGHLQAASDSVSVQIGQKIRLNGKEEVWGSLLVQCKEQPDGTLEVEVLVFHPDWDEPIRLASIQSNCANGNSSQTALQIEYLLKQADARTR